MPRIRSRRKQVALVNKVLPHSPSRSAHRPVGRGGQTSRNRGVKWEISFLIGAGGGVVEFIHNDVVEMVAVELTQMTDTPNVWTEAKEDFRIRLFPVPVCGPGLASVATLAKAAIALRRISFALRHDKGCAPSLARIVSGGQQGFPRPVASTTQTGPVPV